MRKVTSIHADCVAAIAGWITGETYPPGTALPIEPALCAELGVSRTVVREAVENACCEGPADHGAARGHTRPAEIELEPL